MSLVILPDIKIDEYIIRIKEWDYGYWIYIIYLTGKKWKRLRGKGMYNTSEIAEGKARAWLEQYRVKSK